MWSRVEVGGWWEARGETGGGAAGWTSHTLAGTYFGPNGQYAADCKCVPPKSTRAHSRCSFHSYRTGLAKPTQTGPQKGRHPKTNRSALSQLEVRTEGHASPQRPCCMVSSLLQNCVKDEGVERNYEDITLLIMSKRPREDWKMSCSWFLWAQTLYTAVDVARY